MEQLERRPREGTLKLLTETQAPPVVSDGTIAPWLQGYISRKEAEDLIKDKPEGCFLVRLSDKAIGYILSYRGQDRCRHFVITQNASGQFALSGDTDAHDSLAQLIEFYKTRPIEPFGEKLTTSCFQTSSSDVYDVVHIDQKDRPSVSVKAVKDMWSHRTPQPGPECSPDRAPYNAPDHTSDQGFNHIPHPTDQAFNYIPDPSDQGFNHILHPSDQGFNHIPDPSDRGFNNISDPSDQGFNHIPDPSDQGFNHIPDPSDRGFNHISDPSDRGFNHISDPSDQGFNHISDLSDQGFNHISDPSDQGFNHIPDPSDQGFNHIPHPSDQGFNHISDRTPICTADHTRNRTPHQDCPPALPPKTCNRRAAPTISYDLNTPPEILPRQPIGGAALRNSLSICLNGMITPYAQMEHKKSNTNIQPQKSPKMSPTTHLNISNASQGGGSLPCIRPKSKEVKPIGGVVPAMRTVYSELNLETFKRRSSPILDNSQGLQQANRQTSFNPPKQSPSPGKRVTCQTYSLLDPREHCLQRASQGLPSSSSLDKLNINPLYQTSWEDCRWGPHGRVPSPTEPASPSVSQQDQNIYHQVPHEPPPAHPLTDNTYELIPDQSFQGGSHSHQSISDTYEWIPDQGLKDDPSSDTYETLNNLPPKNSESGPGVKVDKWWRFFYRK